MRESGLIPHQLAQQYEALPEPERRAIRLWMFGMFIHGWLSREKLDEFDTMTDVALGPEEINNEKIG